MDDKQPTLTAAALAAIGYLIDNPNSRPTIHETIEEVRNDRARLYEALERMSDIAIMNYGDRYCIPGMPGDLQWFETKDAAIDALLGAKQ